MRLSGNVIIDGDDTDRSVSRTSPSVSGPAPRPLVWHETSGVNHSCS
jgi:hypothetical protein